MPPGKLVARQWMGQEVVGWRDDTGRICVANAFCPHLGAKLAPETGGTVRDGRLVCPFHGFTYDTTGACVATPSGFPAVLSGRRGRTSRRDGAGVRRPGSTAGRTPGATYHRRLC